MKQVLIYFCIVLLLLTLLSSFGGSIKIVNEPFIDENPARKISYNDYGSQQDILVDNTNNIPTPISSENNNIIQPITENDKLIEPFEESDNNFASVPSQNE